MILFHVCEISNVLNRFQSHNESIVDWYGINTEAFSISQTNCNCFGQKLKKKNYKKNYKNFHRLKGEN